MARSRGRRYDNEKKLNVKKVIAVIIAILVIIMFVVGIKVILKDKPNTNEKAFSTAYYTIYENGKWGVIDTKGKVVVEPTYSEMIVIPNNEEPVFFCMENVDYENGTYETKVINNKNEQLFKGYDKVEVLYNHDENNNLWYEKSALKVQKDGKYGLINYSGKQILDCTKDDIQVIEGTKTVFVTIAEGKKGLVNNLGKEIISNKYTEITSLTNEYENGFIVKNEEGKYGVINYNGTVALEEKYDEIKKVYGNNMYVVKEGNSLKIVNSEGSNFLEGQFDNVKSINGQNVIVVKDNKYGVLTITGEQKIEPTYEELTYAYSNYYIAKKDSKYGIISLENEEKLPLKYKYVKYVSEANFIQAENENSESELIDTDFNVKAKGIIAEINQNKNYIRVRVGSEYKYYNFKLEEKENTEILYTNTIFLSKKDGKYGYVNSKGIVVVDYIYEDATEQNKYGYVAVKKDGKWGALDQKGKVVVEPTYTLNNALVIDFISSWHLASDINANYYTK